MTSIACAREVGVSQPAWIMWENGVRLPKIELLAEVCDLLQITPNYLLGYDDPPSAPSAPPRETKPSISTGDGSPVVNGGVNGSGNIVGNSINVTPPPINITISITVNINGQEEEGEEMSEENRNSSRNASRPVPTCDEAIAAGRSRTDGAHVVIANENFSHVEPVISQLPPQPKPPHR